MAVELLESSHQEWRWQARSVLHEARSFLRICLVALMLFKTLTFHEVNEMSRRILSPLMVRRYVPAHHVDSTTTLVGVSVVPQVGNDWRVSSARSEKHAPGFNLTEEIVCYYIQVQFGLDLRRLEPCVMIDDLHQTKKS